MKKEEGYILVEEGLRLHYCSVGTGPNTVIIPAKAGLAGDLEVLANGRKLIFYDQRGRGQSDLDPNENNIWNVYEVNDYEAIRQHFGLEKMSLIGWSYNGAMSALYAADYPDHVDRLVMMCPILPRSDAPYRDPEGIKQKAENRVDPTAANRLNKMKDEGLDTTDPELYCRESMKVNLPRQMGRPESLAQMRSDPCAFPNEWPINKAEHTRQHFPEKSMVWDWRKRVTSIKTPTLVIHGEEDLIPLESSLEWAEAIPQARLLTIACSGHFPHLEAPDIYFSAVEKFLDGGWPEGLRR